MCLNTCVNGSGSVESAGSKCDDDDLLMHDLFLNSKINVNMCQILSTKVELLFFPPYSKCDRKHIVLW